MEARQLLQPSSISTSSNASRPVLLKQLRRVYGLYSNKFKENHLVFLRYVTYSVCYVRYCIATFKIFVYLIHSIQKSKGNLITNNCAPCWCCFRVRCCLNTAVKSSCSIRHIAKKCNFSLSYPGILPKYAIECKTSRLWIWYSGDWRWDPSVFRNESKQTEPQCWWWKDTD